MPILMFACFTLGFLIMFLGYLPDQPLVSTVARWVGLGIVEDYYYVIIGFILFAVGLLFATRYR